MLEHDYFEWISVVSSWFVRKYVALGHCVLLNSQKPNGPPKHSGFLPSRQWQEHVRSVHIDGTDLQHGERSRRVPLHGICLTGVLWLTYLTIPLIYPSRPLYGLDSTFAYFCIFITVPYPIRITLGTD